MRFPNPDRVFPGLGVRGLEGNRLLTILCQDEVPPWSRVNGKALFVLELTIDLNLEAAILPVANIGGNGHATIWQWCDLETRAGNRLLRARALEHEIIFVFQIEFRRVLRREGTGFGRLAAIEEDGSAESQQGDQNSFH